MNSPFRFFLSRLLAVFLLACGFISASARAQGFTAPTLWTLESLQDADSDWWQSLRVQTVPGVVYKLQKSNTLAEGSWENIATHYGSDSEWICPVMPGTEPIAPPPPGTPQIPVFYSTFQHVNLIIEIADTGGTLISWTSLDNGALLRMVLPGVTLDPAWEEYDSFYLNLHGGYFFALSPRLYPPVNFTGSAPTLGPLDTAMVAGFIAALPTITSELETSVANAASYTPVPADPDSKGFFRIHANWQVDSDGDGRLDWEEIIFDNNNPFCADSDGDGQNDEAQDNDGPYPPLTEEETPLARSTSSSDRAHHPRAFIEQQVLQASREVTYSSDPDGDTETNPFTTLENGPFYGSGYDAGDPERQSFEGADNFSDFADAVDGIPFQGTIWETYLREFSSTHQRWNHESGAPGYESHTISFSTDRARFRLKLTGPAPEGGYRIPLRIGRVYQSLDPSDGERELIAPPEGEDPYFEITLEVDEGETVGPPVDVEIPDLGQGRRVVFVPIHVETREYAIPPEDPQTPAPLGLPPLDGICVLPDEPFQVYSGGFAPDIEDAEIQWQKRRLIGGGVSSGGLASFGPWEWLAGPGGNAEGARAFVSTGSPGSYQLQAVLVLPNGTNIEFPFVRSREARFIRSGANPPAVNAHLRAGEPDYFGVSPNTLSKAVRDLAVIALGTTRYALQAGVPTLPGSPLNPSTTNRNKCNIFVTHIANRAGATTPYYTRRWGFVISAPLAKEDWFSQPEDNVDLDVPGWTYQGSSGPIAPGKIVAGKGGGGSGHVGVIDYDGSWISAGSKMVNKHIHFKQLAPAHREFTIRARP